MHDEHTEGASNGLEIAIIGMAGRFPGAPNLPAFWENIRQGVESITRFTGEELTALGVDPAALAHPGFVKAGAVLKDSDRFDAAFFGYSPREAEILDPQHRLFLECSWEALEDAAYTHETYAGVIGVYAGTSLSTYLLFNLLDNPTFTDGEDNFPIMVGNDKDFLSTRVSYKLNLKGPSIDVQTGCSTSLVAVHLACQGLQSYQCDLALAGGVSINVPQRTGYYYQPGGINSPDGHCRAFDAQAQGTIFGSGVGVVVLKRLEDALADGDTIHAVIKGSAINNDGAAKAGYTAPGVEGQTEVIARAQAIAGIDVTTIGYVEAHGTATALGDPIEVQALTNAFRAHTQKKGFCSLGSVKTNIGHLDAAAGVAGLIKATLALKHKQIPPSLHFEQPNPAIDFAGSPFFVSTELTEWHADGIRRAGVSSFGIGGTNAHLILEEAPPPAASGPARPWQLLLLSAKTETALETATANLAEYLRCHPDHNLADIAYTSQAGRKTFNHRRIAVCRDHEDASVALETLDPAHVISAYQESQPRSIVFMFPGGGAQYVNMGREIYLHEPVFREHVDRCAELLKPRLGYDLRQVLYPHDRPQTTDHRPPTADTRSPAHPLTRSPVHGEQGLTRTSLALPALFAVEYALAKLWISWGVRPGALIGHSLGEYVAACLAGVFTLEDALALVLLRGRLFERLPGGSMLSVPLAEEDVRGFLNQQLSIAAVNGPSYCVVSGPTGAIDEMAARLDQAGIDFQRVQIDVAAHSHMVEPLLEPFVRFVEQLRLHPPTIPYLSNVTGTWVKDEEATDPHYWARHLRQTVRFGDGIGELLGTPGRILLEVGPGKTLCTLAKLQAHPAHGQVVLSSIRHPNEQVSDLAFLLMALGKLWLAGTSIDWAAFSAGERRRRLSIPAYPFERRRYWIEPPTRTGHAGPRGAVAKKSRTLDDWFYYPAWRHAAPLHLPGAEQIGAHAGCWLVFIDSHSVGAGIVRRLEGLGHAVVCVEAGQQFRKSSRHAYTIDLQERDDYVRLIQDLQRDGMDPAAIIHLWSVLSAPRELADRASFDAAQRAGFYSLLYLSQAITEQQNASPVRLWVVSNNTQSIESTDTVHPEKTTLLGLCKVIPQEYEQILCRYIDVRVSRAGSAEHTTLIDQMVAELFAPSAQPIVAYRGKHRWVQSYERLRLEGQGAAVRRIRPQGIYVLTGGLGGIGLALAGHLARTAQARLVLTTRSFFPERSTWESWITAHPEDDPYSRKIRNLLDIEARGGEVLIVHADVADESQMRDALARAIERFGALHGVIHLAGITGQKAITLISEIEQEHCEAHFRAKVHGLYVLDDLLQGKQLDFCLLFSSNASVLGGLGSACYTAANLFMDAFASEPQSGNAIPWISVNWDGWLHESQDSLFGAIQTSLDQYAMTAQEGIEAFNRIVSMASAHQVVVSTGDLAGRLELWINRKPAPGGDTAAPELRLHARPGLQTKYAPPSNAIEQKIAGVWQELLGIDQPGVHDNFFDLGGNSMIGLKVMSRLKRELGIDVPIVRLFEGPTISALASVIHSERAADTYEASHSRGEQRRMRVNRKSAYTKP